VSIAVATLGAACQAGVASPPARPAAADRIANLHAFARLYGVVRWFHPSDAAALYDWDRFAIDGVHCVIDAPTPQALRIELAALLAPIAPTVQLAGAGQPFPDQRGLRPVASDSDEVVSWEHAGYGDSVMTGVYASKRRHRSRTIATGDLPYGALWQAVDAAPYRGARVRLRGKLRTASTALGRLWVRVERKDATGFSDNMSDRPLTSRAWSTIEIEGTVDRDATRIVFGPIMAGSGTVWYDDVELAVQGVDGAWRPIAIEDPGFEAADPWVHWKPGMDGPPVTSFEGWRATVDHDRPASGAGSLRVEPMTRVVGDELFADAPQPGETVDVELGSGLRARVPIALYSRDGHTIGDDPSAARRAQAEPFAPPSTGFDAMTGLADVIVAWNVLQHFWPYWEVISVDWIGELDAALRDALDDRTLDEHVATLLRMSAAAPDGHARVTCGGKHRRIPPPFAVDVIEGQVVVVASADPEIRIGDIVLATDGHDASAELAAIAALASGSPQWRQVKARLQFGTGDGGSKLSVRVRRGHVEHDVTVERRDSTLQPFTHPSIERLDDGTYYVDLSRASTTQFDAELEQIASAPAVVFDMRDRPHDVERVLSHLLAQPDDQKTWLAVPHVIRPDHRPSSVQGWDTSGWQLPVTKPHIAGRVAFLAGPASASYPESALGLIEYYHLGAIVGAATAGANGNIAQIAEPSGCSTVFTGLRVTRLDGSRFHLIGIQPTIPASRTIAGVIAGRDEVLETALAYLRGGSK
jgi:hypothetical protein